jgi:hypothetical protein
MSVIAIRRAFDTIRAKIKQTDEPCEDHSCTEAKFRHGSWPTFTSGFRRRLIVSPALGRRVQRNFGWLTGGNRLQALTLLCYIIMHIAIVSTHYPTMEQNIYYKSREIQRLRYVSDRTGVLMSSSMPFIWLFGTRNNIFLWATGLSFSTTQIFHRWVSLIFALEAIVHGSCFTAYYLQRKVPPTFYDGPG